MSISASLCYKIVKHLDDKIEGYCKQCKLKTIVSKCSRPQCTAYLCFICHSKAIQYYLVCNYCNMAYDINCLANPDSRVDIKYIYYSDKSPLYAEKIIDCGITYICFINKDTRDYIKLNSTIYTIKYLKEIYLYIINNPHRNMRYIQKFFRIIE